MIQTTASYPYFIYAYPRHLGDLTTIHFGNESAHILTVCDLYTVTAYDKGGRPLQLNVYVNRDAGA